MKLWLMLLRLIGGLLPVAQRARYLEEWQADLAGAEQLGIARRLIVTGALRSCWQIRVQRDPVVELAPGARAFMHARWAVALLGAGGILGLGAVATGGYVPAPDAVAPIRAVLQAAGWVVPALALPLLLAGYRKLTHALQAMVTPERAPLVNLALMLALLVAVYLFVAVGPGSAFSLYLVALITGLVIMVNGNFVPRQRRILQPRTRRTLAVAAGLSLLVMIGASVLQILVWNPLAKLPELELSQIYRAINDAGESTGESLVLGWVICWCFITLGFVVACYRARPAVLAEGRGLLGVWLLLVSLLGGGYFIASFPLGMSLADTFGLGGGDAGSVSTAIFLLADLCLAAAVYLGANPGRLALPAGQCAGDTA